MQKRGNLFLPKGEGFYKKKANELDSADGQTLGNILSRENHMCKGISTKLVSCLFAFMNND